MTKLYVYPENLRSKVDESKGYQHVAFEFKKRNSPQTSNKVHLYLPPGFSVPDSASYGSLDLGVLGSRVGSESELTKGEKEDLAVFGAGKFAANFGAEALFTKEKIQQGVAQNPNTVLQFDNVAVRNFSFTFKMVSESAEEAQQALIIENLFRKALYPELKSDRALFLTYPDTFIIRFYHGDRLNQFMPQIQESYLQSMTTTYNAGSNMYHSDGSPTEIDLNLTFTETQALTREKLYDPSPESSPESNTGFGRDSVVREVLNVFNGLRGR